MAGVAIPPAVPIPAAPPAAPQGSVHSHEDAVANKLAAAMFAKAAAQPNGVAVPAAPAVDTPPVPATPASTDPTPVVEIQSAAIPAEINLEDVDFDAPETPIEAAPGVEVPPAADGKIPDSEVSSKLEEMLARGEVPDKIEEMFLKHSRGKEMLNSYKTLRELRKSPDEGGIGRIPSLDEIREGDSARQQMMAMKFEAVNDPVSFVSNLFTVDPQSGVSVLGTMEQTAQVLQTIPQVLLQAAQKTQNPVYAQMVASYSAPVFKQFFDYQYNIAMSMPQGSDQEKVDKGRVLDGLQLMEYKAFGAARPLNLNANGAPATAVGADDPEKAALQARLQQYEQQFRQDQQYRINSVVSQVETSGKEAALSDIGKAMAQTGINKVYPDAVLRPHRSDIYNEIQAGLPTHDPSGWQTYQIQLQQAARGQVDPKVPANTFRLLFQNALRNSPQVRTRLNDLVKDAKSVSDGQHVARSQAQLRVETGAPGVPIPQSVVSASQPDRQPGETREEYFARRIAAKMPSSQGQVRPS